LSENVKVSFFTLTLIFSFSKDHPGLRIELSHPSTSPNIFLLWKDTVFSI